jgi:ABC-type uncharacterized transport system ATPase subunit
VLNLADAAAEVLALSRITKRFGALRAVHDASFSLRRGEIHALVGENGAGKSTLMNIAYGIHRPDNGTILLDGEAVALASPAAALGHGIGMVPQHFKLAPSFTVAENIVVGAEPRVSWGRIDHAAAMARTRALGTRFGLELDPATCPSGCSSAWRSSRRCTGRCGCSFSMSRPRC